MALEILVNTDSGDGLLLDGTKPLPDPMLISHLWHLPDGNFTGNAPDISV